MTTGIVRIQVLTNLDFIVHVMMLGCWLLLCSSLASTDHHFRNFQPIWIVDRMTVRNVKLGDFDEDNITDSTVLLHVPRCFFMKNSEWIDFEQEWINKCTYITCIYTFFHTHTYIHIYTYICAKSMVYDLHITNVCTSSI